LALTTTDMWFFISSDLKNVAFYVPRIGMNRTCTWLAGSARDAATLCMQNSSVYYICEETCGACSDLCSDDPSFTFDFAGGRYNCKWLSVRSRNHEAACKLSAINEACAETCDSCPEPSGSPSSAPMNKPLPQDITTPAPMGVAPTSSSTPAHTVAPTFGSTPAPTVATTCYDDDYAKFMVTMDNSDVKKQGCIWLRARLAMYGPTLCSPLNGAAYAVCPATCKKCDAQCSDKTDYVFEDLRGGIRDCAWLSKITRDRDAYCKAGADAFCKQSCETC
jgi:hypothetical protein